jgi:hypothetical protein
MKMLINGRDIKLPIYKVLNENMTHNGYVYSLGTNTDSLPFNPKGSCESGGLYFANILNIINFFNYGTKTADVELKDDEPVWYDHDKYKAHTIILTNIRDLKYFEIPDQYALDVVKQDGLALDYVKDQTPEICLEAVKQDGLALDYVKDQTPEICLEAVKQSGRALEFVKEQTPELCLEAVEQTGYAIQFVKEQTLELCLEAVEQTGWTLEFIKEQTPEICLAAVKEDGQVLYLLKNKQQKSVLKLLNKMV